MTPRVWMFSDAPYVGGAEAYLRWHLEAAGPSRIGVVALDRPGLAPWLRALEAEGFEVDALEPAGAWWRDLRRFSAWCRERQPQLLHVNMPGPYDGLMALAPLAAKFAGVRRVAVTEHLPGVGRVGKRYWAKRVGLRAIDRAIVVCEAHREVMIDTFGYRDDRVVAIRNGVEDPRRREGAPVEEALPRRERHPGVRFVQVGSLDERKGGDLLLRAFAGAVHAGVRANLWFVGEGPARGAWEALARSLGVADRAFFAGHLPRGDLAWSGADVAVLASAREGLPLSLLEAAAWGRPIVATRVDGVAEVVVPGENGWLVEAGDERALRGALVEAASEARRREAYGRRSRVRYESLFSRERMISETFALYESLCPGAIR